MLSVKSLVVAATVAAGVLFAASDADAQWRRSRSYYTYPVYTYPTYTYSPGVYTTHSYPRTYVSSDGVITTGYTYPYSGRSNSTWDTRYYDPWMGAGARGMNLGPIRIRW
jgi:hypothetical protein